MIAPETGRLGELFARVGHALDQFLERDQLDPAPRAAQWQAALSQPLPKHGAGRRRGPRVDRARGGQRRPVL